MSFDDYTSARPVQTRVTYLDWELDERAMLRLKYRNIDHEGVQSMDMRFHPGSPIGKALSLVLQLAEAEISIRHNL